MASSDDFEYVVDGCGKLWVSVVYVDGYGKEQFEKAPRM